MKSLDNRWPTSSSVPSQTYTNGASYVTIVPPASGIYTLTLPPNMGSANQFLKTDGINTTTWSDLSPYTGNFVINGTLDVNINSPSVNLPYAITNSNTTASTLTGMKFGQSSSVGNGGVMYFVYNGDNSTNNYVRTSFYGDSTQYLQIYNDLNSTGINFNGNFHVNGSVLKIANLTIYTMTTDSPWPSGGGPYYCDKWAVSQTAGLALTYSGPEFYNHLGRDAYITVTWTVSRDSGGLGGINQYYIRFNGTSTKYGRVTCTSGNYTTTTASFKLADNQFFTVVGENDLVVGSNFAAADARVHVLID